jgi:hypothetical protein
MVSDPPVWRLAGRERNSGGHTAALMSLVRRLPDPESVSPHAIGLTLLLGSEAAFHGCIRFLVMRERALPIRID